jgi:hypothetical protein
MVRSVVDADTPAQPEHECAARVRAWVGLSPEIEGNCVTVRWGEEQSDVYLRSEG